MKGVYIYPSDIGVSSEWDEKWITFIKKFEFIEGTPWNYVLVVQIDIG